MVGPKPPIGFRPSKFTCGKSIPLLLVLRAIGLLVKVLLAHQPRGILRLDELDLSFRVALDDAPPSDSCSDRATNGSKEREESGGRIHEIQEFVPP